MKTCKTCKDSIGRYIEKKSFRISKKRSSDNTHFHYGATFYRYGICVRHHYNRYKRTKVLWDPCIRCKFQGVTKYKIKREPSNEEIIETLRLEIEKLKKDVEFLKGKSTKIDSPKDLLDLDFSEPEKYSKFKKPQTV